MGIYKIHFQPALLQATQAQVSQPFLVGEVLQSPNRELLLIFRNELNSVYE